MEIHIGNRVADVTLVSKEGNKVQLTIDGVPYDVDIVMAENGSCSILHDGQSYNAELIRKEEAMGWCVLDNRTVYLRCGGDSISLSGITCDRRLNRQRHDRRLPDFDFGSTYRDVPASVFNITVSHIPQLWDEILDAGYGDLTLSGHVHGMQCKIRLFGRSFSPAQWMYERWSGRYEERGRTLYINDGIGCVGYPMRLGVKPEITLIELQR